MLCPSGWTQAEPDKYVQLVGLNKYKSEMLAP